VITSWSGDAENVGKLAGASPRGGLGGLHERMLVGRIT
jgi:hypothetical protein